MSIKLFSRIGRFTCALILALQAGAMAARPDSDQSWRGLPGVTIEPHWNMRGKKMPWDHEIQVALPPSYSDSGQDYPVLWVLDGSGFFESAVRVVTTYARGIYQPRNTPEMIVVGVGVPRDRIAELMERRNYDFSHSPGYQFADYGSELLDPLVKKSQYFIGGARRGGAPHFLSFLVDELQPEIEKRYRASGNHTLWGYSGGGTFCAYALVYRPQSFQRYICSSGSMYGGNKEIFRLEQEYARSHKDLPAKVYFSVGEQEAVEGGIISGFGVSSSTTRLVEILTLRQYPSLELHFEVLKDEDHYSALPLSMSRGLRKLWRGSNDQQH